MAAIIATRFPHKAPELFAYQATIVRAERNYEGKRWVAYDRQEALARRDLDWSVTDSRLYNEAFTGRARAIARCAVCLQDDDAASQCPRNPNRLMVGWLPDPTLCWPNQFVHPGVPVSRHTPTPLAGGQEVCRRFNHGHCTKQRCRYAHSCSGCGGPHAHIHCTQKGGPLPGRRSRSPLRPSAGQNLPAKQRY